MSNIEASAYWVSSIDEWKKPVEIVQMYNEMNESYAELCIKYAGLIERYDNLVCDYTAQIEINKCINHKLTHLEKRVRQLNDILDKIRGWL